jgi:hypothetical protein
MHGPRVCDENKVEARFSAVGRESQGDGARPRELPHSSKRSLSGPVVEEKVKVKGSGQECPLYTVEKRQSRDYQPFWRMRSRMSAL